MMRNDMVNDVDCYFKIMLEKLVERTSEERL